MTFTGAPVTALFENFTDKLRLCRYLNHSRTSGRGGEHVSVFSECLIWA